MSKKVGLEHPGQILKEYYLDEMGITAYQLAKAIGVDQTRISKIIRGDRAITVETGLKLSKFFGLSDKFFINLQTDYDARMFKREHKEKIDMVEPFKRAKIASSS